MDELGAGAAVIAGCFLVAAGLEAIVAPVAGRISDRRGRLAPGARRARRGRGRDGAAAVARRRLAARRADRARRAGDRDPLVARDRDALRRRRARTASSRRSRSRSSTSPGRSGRRAGSAGSARLADATERPRALPPAGRRSAQDPLTFTAAPARRALACPPNDGRDHRRQGDRAGRSARRSARTSRRGCERRHGPPAWPRCWSATTPPRRSTSAASRRPPPRSASRASTTGWRRTPPTTRSERAARRLNADPAVSGILLQLPTPPQVDGAALTELIDPAKDVDGLTPISAGPAGQGPARPAPVHAERRDGAAAPPRRGARGRRGRRRRPLATSSASRSPRCCWRPTPPSPPATRAPATSPRSAAAPTCSSPPSDARSSSRATGSRRAPP